MVLNIFINIILMWVLWLLLRRPHLYSSLGLPLVYLAGLELIHLPGAYAHALPWSSLSNTRITEIGFTLTTLAAACFVVGVWLARQQTAESKSVNQSSLALPCRLQPYFLRFCVFGGWISMFVFTPITRLPTIGAFFTFASNLWIVGIVLALPLALQSRNLKRIGIWLGAMLVFPLSTMILGGFLSYGAASTMACSFSSFSSARKAKRALITAILVSLLSLSFFLTYFGERDAFRSVAWSGADVQSRIAATRSVFGNFAWLDVSQPDQLKALDERLNQNYFVGLAAERLQEGSVEYLGGASLWDGVLALVPRALWPEKPIKAGSGTLVANMTGLKLSSTTSFGVGNVMEAYINFAIPGIVIGFFLFGYVLAKLDYYAALADLHGDIKTLLVCFLPAVAMIQPNGSFFEIVSGGVMSWCTAICWHNVWQWWSGRRTTVPLLPNTPHSNGNL
jgi:hypothetical protein